MSDCAAERLTTTFDNWTVVSPARLIVSSIFCSRARSSRAVLWMRESLSYWGWTRKNPINPNTTNVPRITRMN